MCACVRVCADMADKFPQAEVIGTDLRYDSDYRAFTGPQAWLTADNQPNPAEMGSAQLPIRSGRHGAGVDVPRSTHALCTPKHASLGLCAHT